MGFLEECLWEVEKHAYLAVDEWIVPDMMVKSNWFILLFESSSF